MSVIVKEQSCETGNKLLVKVRFLDGELRSILIKHPVLQAHLFTIRSQDLLIDSGKSPSLIACF